MAVGCQQTDRSWNDFGNDSEGVRGSDDATGQPASSAPAMPINRVYAYVAGEAITGEAMFPALLEASGGDILNDLVLDRLVERRLHSLGIEMTPDLIDAERDIVARTLAENEDDAARLLRELRERRGLGDTRFDALLRRNAGLRAMVRDKVTLTDAALRQAYRLRYGPSRRVRLLLCDTLAQAQRLRALAVDEAQPFGELAALHSVDPSAAQGGLLSPIRPDDTSYPAALRAAVSSLSVGQVSQPLALEARFALVRVEEEIPGSERENPYDQVKPVLERAVRLRAERAMMQQTARELLSAADVTVLDPALKADWERQRDALVGE